MITELNSGNWIDYYGAALEFTPYARAVLAYYPIQIPVFSVIPSGFTGVAGQFRSVVTDPFEYDVLFVGANANFRASPNAEDEGQNVYLQVTNLQSGLTICAPGPINGAPITSFAGSGVRSMPVFLFPEAFLVPAGVRMKFDFFAIDQSLVFSGGSITFLGVQCINLDANFKTPECVLMPNGETIKIDGRLPWFYSIGLGMERFTGSNQSFTLNTGDPMTFYSPPIDCDIEIHDLNCNWFTQLGVDSQPDQVLFRIENTTEERMWTINWNPATAVMGDFSKAYLGLPFNKPTLLKKNSRLRISTINRTSPSNPLTQGVLVLRGVQLCEY